MSDRKTQLVAAVDAVRAASRVCIAVQRALVDADTLEKKDKSPVTVKNFADYVKAGGLFPIPEGKVGRVARLIGTDGVIEYYENTFQYDALVAVIEAELAGE